MTTKPLTVTAAQWQWLASSIPQDRGLDMRVMLLSMHLNGGKYGDDDWSATWDISEADLWILDSYLYYANPWKADKLSDGSELLDFAKKVWHLLILLHGSTDKQYQIGGSDARTSTSNDTDENRADARTGSLTV